MKVYNYHTIYAKDKTADGREVWKLNKAYRVLNRMGMGGANLSEGC
jgi:hypothetical protein